MSTKRATLDEETSTVSDPNDTTRIIPPGGGARGAMGSDDLPIGSEIGNYVTEQVIGSGGGGTVFAARHRVLGRRVAIKVLREEMASFPAMVARFVREAAAVNKIRHPNIVDIHEFGEVAPGRPYYVMELLEGMDLRKMLHLCGRFSPREALDLFEPICSAVQAAHEAGIVHRDIKASNVLVVEGQGTRTIKLLDFGIAKMLHGESAGQGLTEPGSMVGTAQNMAPEQIRCERIDLRADVYALGVLLFQLLTGNYPFEAGDPMQIAMMHLQAPIPRPSASAPVPPALDAVVVRCLEKSPAKRFASVSDLIAEFRRVLGDEPVLAKDDAVLAVGIYFEVAARNDDEMDDAMIEDMGVLLDTAERHLSTAAFTFPLRTSTSLLGVRIIGNDADRDAERGAAEASLETLKAHLAELPGRHPGVEFTTCFSIGQAICRPSPNGVEIVGGPLLDVGTWTEQGPRRG